MKPLTRKRKIKRWRQYVRSVNGRISESVSFNELDQAVSDFFTSAIAGLEIARDYDRRHR